MSASFAVAVSRGSMTTSLGGCRRAETRVAIQVVSSKTSMCDDRERIILFEKELTRVVDADGAARVLLDCFARATNDQIDSLVPTGFFKLIVATNEQPL